MVLGQPLLSDGPCRPPLTCFRTLSRTELKDDLVVGLLPCAHGWGPRSDTRMPATSTSFFFFDVFSVGAVVDSRFADKTRQVRRLKGGVRPSGSRVWVWFSCFSSSFSFSFLLFSFFFDFVFFFLFLFFFFLFTFFFFSFFFDFVFSFFLFPFIFTFSDFSFFHFSFFAENRTHL